MTTGLVALPEIRSPISVGADSDHDDYCGSMMNFPLSYTLSLNRL